VTKYLDYAEQQAEEEQSMTMKDWALRLDGFLKFNKKDLLTNAGKVSAEVAKKLAEAELDKYEEKRRHIEATTQVSDFDKLVVEAKNFEASAAKKIVQPKTKIAKMKK
jgi:hypothetical protein